MGAGSARPASHDRTQRGVIALTMGDPAGIGPELTLKLWHEASRGSQVDDHAIVLYGDPAMVSDTARTLGLGDPVEVVVEPSAAVSVWPARLPVVPVTLARPAIAGQPDVANAAAIIQSIEAATVAVARGVAHALVTNPIAKNVLYAAGFAHPGHTEFLAELAARHWPGRTYFPVMMMASPELRVVPLTIHIPLSAVPGHITGRLIRDTARIVHDALIRDFSVRGRTASGGPRIAVTGLNPHAGESGTIGHEERDIIAPAIEALRKEGLSITGPHAADALFRPEARRTYDAVITMYHDQALIPSKALAFDTGVNVTLGLPFIRTSPDHGPAFDIAGRGEAAASSLIESVRLAAQMSANRAAAP